jgi:hypothetical protein
MNWVSKCLIQKQKQTLQIEMCKCPAWMPRTLSNTDKNKEYNKTAWTCSANTMIHHQSHLPLQELNSWENLTPTECSKLENGLDFVLATRAAFSDKDDDLESRNFNSIDENVTQIPTNHNPTNRKQSYIYIYIEGGRGVIKKIYHNKKMLLGSSSFGVFNSLHGQVRFVTKK